MNRSAIDAPQKSVKNAFARRSFERFMANRLAVLGLVFALLLTLASLVVPFISPHGVNDMNTANRLAPPSLEHPLGTDSLGRDFMTRLLYGGRVSIAVSITSALICSFIGVIIGCVAGYIGGKIDDFLIFVSEIFSTFPTTILILILVGFMGRSLLNLVLIFGLTSWMSTARIVRGRVLSLREEPFVEYYVSNGISGWSIMFRHLIPNMFGPITVAFTLNMAGFVLAEAGLSFLGLGAPSAVPTWGNLINAARSLNVIQNYPMLWIAPGVVISIFVLGINFFGDGLRDALDATQ